MPELDVKTLVVDDDPINRMLVVDFLQARGYTVHEGEDGEAGWKLFREILPDFLVIDWMMPRMKGPELARHIRAHPEGSDAVLLMLTSRNESADFQQALDAGVDDYIIKPFTPGDLEVRIQILEKRLRQIMERRRLAESLARSEYRLSSLIENAGVPMVMTDLDGVIRAVNNTFAELTGFAKENLLGRRRPFPFWNEDEAGNLEAAQKVLHRKNYANVESVFQTKEGRSFPVMVTMSPVFDEQGLMSGFFTVVEDLTDRKEAELAMVRAERLAAVGTLAAGIAHQFNNIHACIQGYLSCLVNHPTVNDDVRGILDSTMKAARRATTISQNMLRFANSSEENTRTPTNLDELLNQTLALVREAFEKKGIVIRFEVKARAVAEINAGEISQVVTNMLVNAEHALLDRPEKVIALETGVRDGQAYIRIADTGCGIPPAELTKVFSPFYSTKGEHAHKNTPQTRVKGTGMGLSVADAIIESCGGRIVVDSQPDKGTAFTIWLPCLKVEASPPKFKSCHAEVQSIAGTRILILDDESLLQSLLTDMLCQENCEVAPTDDPAHALEMTTTKTFDLAIVDIDLHQVAGAEFLHRLNQMPATERPPLFLLLGKGVEEGLKEFDTLVYLDTIPKPFTQGQILEKIRAARRKTATC